MLKAIFYKRLVLLLGIGLLSCLFVTKAQDNDKPFVRLATYWDAPGRVKAISADDRWIVIYDRNDNISRLVEVATGQVEAKSVSDTGIRFSPKGRFASVYKNDTHTLQILELDTNRLVAEVGSSSHTFSADDSLVMVDHYDESASEYATKVIEPQTGNISLQIQGIGYNFSPDARLITVTDTHHKIAKVIEIKTSKTVFEFPLRDYSEGKTWSFQFRFSPDGQFLALYQLHDYMTYIIDTASWKTLYNIYGFVNFNADSRFLNVRQSDGGEAGELLLEARSGKQIDKVYGNMWFSADGKLVYASDSTNCAYGGYTRVTELSPMRTLANVEACVNVDVLDNHQIMEVYDAQIDGPRIKRFIEISTGRVLWQVDAFSVDVIDFDRHLVRLTLRNQETIENFKTGEVFASDQDIVLSWSKQYAFASNGLLVDLYGSQNMKDDTMPAPRMGGGIVQAPKGKINIYPTPNDAHPIVEEDNNPFDFSVIGKSADEQWLYVVYTIVGCEIIRKQGWVANQNLTVIEDWHDVPVLDASDPLASLREVSERFG